MNKDRAKSFLSWPIFYNSIQFSCLWITLLCSFNGVPISFRSLRNAKISIISYGLISLRNNRNASLLKTIQVAKFGVTIVDESHYLKNRQSARTKNLMKFLKGMKRVILLTGTPSLARPDEVMCGSMIKYQSLQYDNSFMI